MGILNVTPDSFSDGGIYQNTEEAVERALHMESEGAHIIDIGGESTRPGAAQVTGKEERKRVLPVIEKIRARSTVPISIDTQKAVVADAALKSGANMVNDVSAMEADTDMVSVIRTHQVPVVIMHMRGSPKTMQIKPEYKHVVTEVRQYLKDRILFAGQQGISKNNIVIDPGIGFGKTVLHNFQILNQLDSFLTLKHPVLLGVSRKSFIGSTLERDVENRLMGTAAAVAASVLAGVHIMRVHDVFSMRDVLLISERIRHPEKVMVRP